MNRIMATWQNGCFGQMDDHPVHTIPNRHPTKSDFSIQDLFQIILAAKCHGIQVHPPTNSDDLCLLFCLYPFYGATEDNKIK